MKRSKAGKQVENDTANEKERVSEGSRNGMSFDDDVRWIGYEKCWQWWHTSCLGMTDTDIPDEIIIVLPAPDVNNVFDPGN